MSRRFKLVAGDRLPELVRAVTDPAMLATDLTGRAVRWLMQRYSDGVTVIDAAATIDFPSSPAKAFRYAWSDTDATALLPGRYRGRFQVTMADGRVWHEPRGDEYIDVLISENIAAIPIPPPIPPDPNAPPPADPVQFAALFNSQGAAQLRALYFKGVNQTIVADAGSTSGFYCTMWDDCLHPGIGRHFRPRLAGNWGTARPEGARCNAQGLIHSEGLYIPASVAADPVHKLSYGDYDTTGNSPLAPGCLTVKPLLLGDDAQGLTYAALARGDGAFLLSANGNDNVPSRGLFRLTSEATVLQPVTDPESPLYRSTWADTRSGQPMLFRAHYRTQHPSAPGGGTQSWILAGDLQHRIGIQQNDTNSSPSFDFGSNAKERSLILGSDLTPYDPTAPQPTDIYWVAIIQGNCSAVQVRILNDWAKIIAPTVWEDTTTRSWSLLGGDSMVTQSVDTVANGGTDTESWPGNTPEPKLYNNVGYQMSRAGQSVGQFQYALLKHFIGRMDFRRLPSMAGAMTIAMYEAINNGTGDAALADNIAFAEMAKAIDPVRVRVVGYDEVAAGRPLTQTEIANARALVPANYHAMIGITDAPMYKPAPYALGTTATEDTEWWNAQHPSRPTQHTVRYGIERARLTAALPAPLSGPTHLERCMLVQVTPGGSADADGTICTLNANGNTFQIVPIPKNPVYTTLATPGRTYTYLSTNPAVATVSAGGLVTRIGAGRCSILIRSDATINGRTDRGYGALSMKCP
jgi:hypothetical protein